MKSFFNLKKLSMTGTVFCLGALLSSQSHALVGFGLKGGINLYSASVTQNTVAVPNAFTSSMGFMGGLGVDIGMGPISLMIDALYTQRKLTYGIGSTSPAAYQTSTSLNIPVQVRVSIIPMLGLTAGGYYELPLGKIKGFTALGVADGEADGVSDYGVVGGLIVNLAMISLETRYSMGLKDQIDTADGAMKTRSIDLLVGYNF